MVWALSSPPPSSFLWPVWIFTGQLAGNTIWIFDHTKPNGWSRFNLDIINTTFSAPLWLSSSVMRSKGWINAVSGSPWGLLNSFICSTFYKSWVGEKVGQNSFVLLKVVWFLSPCSLLLFCYSTVWMLLVLVGLVNNGPDNAVWYSPRLYGSGLGEQLGLVLGVHHQSLCPASCGPRILVSTEHLWILGILIPEAVVRRSIWCLSKPKYLQFA